MGAPVSGARRSPGPGRAVAAVTAVTATYVYFLLFAQYGFLRLARERLVPGAGADLRPALAAMGVAGLLTSLAAARLLARRSPAALLGAGFGLGAVVAALAPLAGGETAFVAIGGAVGVALALITVPLATWLPALLAAPGAGLPLGLGVGLGTGLAYWICNLPPVFEGAPAVQATLSAGAALLGLGATRLAARTAGGPATVSEPGAGPARGLGDRDARGLAFAAVVLSFLALVWLDSAAFAVIQETAPLKAPTWGSPAHQLWMGAVHLLAAVLAGWAIDRGAFRGLLLAAFGLFTVAFTTLQSGAGPVAAAGPIYAVGISLYSVALVAFPGLVRERCGPGGGACARLVPRRWRAAALYGIAGWLGSALGVGMAQNLHAIPVPFLWAAGLLLAASWLASMPQLLHAARTLAPALAWASGAGLLALAAALPGGDLAPPATDPAGAVVARGRRVYVDEGCVNCHSQYVRPLAGDVARWGPHRPLDREQAPVLIGNRRQGPDLLNVGVRRSPTWQRLHLLSPRSLSPGSRMPSYAHLFAGDGQRGADLVAYLDSLGAPARAARHRQVQALSPWTAIPPPAGDPERGRRSFLSSCAPCHGPRGRGDGPLASELEGRALDLGKPGFWLVSWGAGGDTLEEGLARLIRWGLPGSDMPGHETLPDRELADLVAYVLSLPAAPWGAGVRAGGGR
jgi:mono/diheme cytochrome c family protein